MKLLASGVENNNDNTLVQSDGENKNMETESVMNDNAIKILCLNANNAI